MGCFTSKKEKIEKLRTLSGGLLKEEQIEELMAKTYFYIDELIYLYDEFKKLNPDILQRINLTSFFDFPHIKYCTFRKLLIYAYGLDIKYFNIEEMEKIKNSEKVLSNNNLIKVNKNVSSKNIREMNKKLSAKLKQITKVQKVIKDDKIDVLDQELKMKENIFKPTISQNNNFISNGDKQMNNEAQREEEITLIDFYSFCNFLKVFNERYPTDFKIKFYFKIFDNDEDGFLSKEDIKRFIQLILPNEFIEDEEEMKRRYIEEDKRDDDMFIKYKSLSSERERKSLKKKIEEWEDKENEHSGKFNVYEVVNILFKEITGSDDRTHIEFEEFQKLMWMSNIDTSCSIQFKPN